MGKNEERDFWDKNVKPHNSRFELIVSKIRWHFYLAGTWIKKRKILNVNDVTWSMADLYRIIYIMMALACLSIFLDMVMDVLMFIYPRLRWYSPEDLVNGGQQFLGALFKGEI